MIFGNFYARISYRSLYDIIIFKSEVNDILDSKHSKYLNNFLISNYIGVIQSKIKLNNYNSIFLCRFKAKRKYMIFNLIDNFLCKLIKVTHAKNKKPFLNF